MTFREILERGIEIPTANYLVDFLLQGERYLGNPMWTRTTLTYTPEGVFINDNAGSNIGESLNDNRLKEGSRQVSYGFKTGRFYSFGEFESHHLVEGIFGESSKKLRALAEKKLEAIIEQYTRELDETKKFRKEIIDNAKKDAEEILTGANKEIERAIRIIKESQAEKEKTRKARKESSPPSIIRAIRSRMTGLR